jgi:tetratricopeptide (TPR) repeat protein
MSGFLVLLVLMAQLALAPLALAAPRPPSLAQLFDQALAASREGSFDQALPLWNQVLEMAPEDAAAWSNRGNVQLVLGDPLAAIADQERAMALEPSNPEPHLNRGIAEEALQRWGAAETDYRWILEPPASPASPASPVSSDKTASPASPASSEKPASSDKPASQLDPEVRAAALYNLGNVQGSQGDWESARNSFRTAADSRPGFAMARSSAALAAFQLGELEQAERELRALIRRYPLFADARAGLTALLWRLGASGEAESNWASASGLDPRYRQPEWLQSTRRWPPAPVSALEQFLALASA